MMRSDRPYTVAMACNSHDRAPDARAKTGVRMKCASVRCVSLCDSKWSIRQHQCVTFENTLHRDAVESTVHCHNGLKIARSRTPRALHNWSAHGVRERAVCESR
eukprot:1471262-Lingulodinium_polyedra.AAC.1